MSSVLWRAPFLPSNHENGVLPVSECSGDTLLLRSAPADVQSRCTTLEDIRYDWQASLFFRAMIRANGVARCACGSMRMQERVRPSRFVAAPAANGNCAIFSHPTSQRGAHGIIDTHGAEDGACESRQHLACEERGDTIAHESTRTPRVRGMTSWSTERACVQCRRLSPRRSGNTRLHCHRRCGSLPAMRGRRQTRCVQRCRSNGTCCCLTVRGVRRTLGRT